MAKTGRPRKATALKQAQGTDQKCRTNPDEPVPLGKFGPPPKKLRAEGKRRWDWLAETAWWLTDADRDTAELYCARWALYMDALKQLGTDGQVWHRKDGYSQMSGALTALGNCEKALMELGAKMGLNPSDRTRIAAPQKPSKSGNRYSLD